MVANFEHRVRDVVNEVLHDALVDEFDWANEVPRFVPSRVIASPRAGVHRERRVAQYEDAGTRMLVIAQAQEIFAYIGELQQEKLLAPKDEHRHGPIR